MQSGLKNLILLLFFLILFSLSHAQTLDKIGKKDMVTVGGGLNYNTTVYLVDGKASFRKPLTWQLGGNFNISILDISLPFTFSFTNAGTAFSQPMNITALHPSYKKWKSHIGVTSMSFSPYTMSGINFAGAGLEYAPGKWSFQGFGGRVKKAIAYNAEVDNYQTVAYRRNGGGFMAGYENSGFSGQIIVIKAADDIKSLKFLPAKAPLFAQDNLVVSFKGKAPIGKMFNLEAEIASSILTQNVLFEGEADRTKFAGKVANLVNGNQSTEMYQAMNGAVNYKYKTFGMGVKYERIDPGYTTLGALSFNNDLENITITPNISLLKGKLTFAANTGFQRNSLNNKAASESKRWVGNISVSGQPLKGLTANASFSNFSSFTKRNPNANPLYTEIGDTMNAYQISKNMSGSLGYGFGKTWKQTFALNGNFSISENITGRLKDAAAFGFNVDASIPTKPTKSIAGVFNHGITLAKSNLTLGWMVNGTQAKSNLTTNIFVGPGVNVSKNFPKKKMSLTSGLVYNQNYLNKKLTNNVFFLRAGFNYKPDFWDKKYGSLGMSINANYSNKFPTGKDLKTIRELTIITNITYGF